MTDQQQSGPGFEVCSGASRYQWTVINTHPTRGRTFCRPLDASEHCFVWDGRFNGTTDSLKHVTLRLSKNGDGEGGRNASLFSDGNIVRAWLDTKRRFPLLGATVFSPEAEVDVEDGIGIGLLRSASAFSNDSAYFVVCEGDLAVVRPGEIVFGQVANAEDAQQRAITLLDHDHGSSGSNTRQLSALLMRLHILREMASADNDVDPVFRLHVIALMSHCITDGMANYSFLRCFLDALARGAEPALPAQLPIAERLAMVVPSHSVECEPAHVRALSQARRRWRRAIGFVILQLKLAKTQGGQTLPWHRTSSTPSISSRSAQVNISLTQAETTAILANCRLHRFTLGNASHVLAQVAMTRVLFRRYLCGEISKEEWEYRKKQPYISGGPVNLRRWLDREWYERGGGGEVLLCLGMFAYQLPFMTLGTAVEERHHGPISDDFGCDADRKVHDFLENVPQFSELLTFDRFLHRVGLVKKQAAAYFKHPLFLEISRAVGVIRLGLSRFAALEWMRNRENKSGAQANSDDKILSATDVPTVWAHVGATLGNVDTIFPSEYPLPPTHPLSPYSPAAHSARAGYATPPPVCESDEMNTNMLPTIVVEYTGTRLHTSPGQLYLSMWTLQEQLRMVVYYDRNVFEDLIVSEWIDEVKEATLWYLGQTHW